MTMERPYVLHMFTPLAQMSPFDVNMAADAGWQVIVPYGGVGIEQIGAMTQDTIFSRGPKGVLRTGMFIGGRDPMLAQDMLDEAKAAMFKPFVVSLMADPSGAFTTAAAMVAKVEAALARQHGRGLQGRRVLVIGTGPVGRSAAVMCAQLGAEVTLSGRSASNAEQAARNTGARFAVSLQSAASSESGAALAAADVVLACAAAGVQVVSAQQLTSAGALKVAADVNAVPPEGVAGLGAMDDAKPLPGSAAAGIGALAIGNVKYQTQQRLLVQMREAGKAVTIGVAEALAMARSVLAEAAGAKPGA
jgi:methylene-tetrahydromethanopterin dehydrogenase